MHITPPSVDPGRDIKVERLQEEQGSESGTSNVGKTGHLGGSTGSSGRGGGSTGGAGSLGRSSGRSAAGS
jgi:hypothetical protein